MKKLANIAGLVGILILQSWLIPAIIQAAQIGQGPPLESCLLMIAGFITLSIHSIAYRVHLYTACNMVGIIGNGILIWLL